MIKSYNRKFFKTIETISKSKSEDDEGDPAVKSNFKMYSFDDINIKKVRKKLKKDNKYTCDHSSVDGIFYGYDEDDEFYLLFVEFKHIASEKEKYCTLKTEFSNDLKLKALESLYCVFPHLIDLYCQNNSQNIYKLREFLFNCKKQYYCVIKDWCSTENTNTQAMLETDFSSINRLYDYPFDVVKIMTPVTFKEFIE